MIGPNTLPTTKQLIFVITTHTYLSTQTLWVLINTEIIPVDGANDMDFGGRRQIIENNANTLEVTMLSYAKLLKLLII